MGSLFLGLLILSLIAVAFNQKNPCKAGEFLCGDCICQAKETPCEGKCLDVADRLCKAKGDSEGAKDVCKTPSLPCPKEYEEQCPEGVVYCENLDKCGKEGTDFWTCKESEDKGILCFDHLWSKAKGEDCKHLKEAIDEKCPKDWILCPKPKKETPKTEPPKKETPTTDAPPKDKDTPSKDKDTPSKDKDTP